MQVCIVYTKYYVINFELNLSRRKARFTSNVAYSNHCKVRPIFLCGESRQMFSLIVIYEYIRFQYRLILLSSWNTIKNQDMKISFWSAHGLTSILISEYYSQRNKIKGLCDSHIQQSVRGFEIKLAIIIYCNSNKIDNWRQLFPYLCIENKICRYLNAVEFTTITKKRR